MPISRAKRKAAARKAARTKARNLDGGQMEKLQTVILLTEFSI